MEGECLGIGGVGWSGGGVGEWQPCMNVRLKNLEFIAKTLRHAHDPIKFVDKCAVLNSIVAFFLMSSKVLLVAPNRCTTYYFTCIKDERVPFALFA